MTNPATRPLAHLNNLAQRHPSVWKGVEYLRSLRGTQLPAWPSWCYLPIAGGMAAATQGRDLNTFQSPLAVARDAAIIAALAAWRPTKGVYQFHPQLLDALWGTPVTGDLPTQVLKRLPEWCVYIPLERELSKTETLHGAWAHLEWDANDHSEELRLLLDVNNELLPIPIDLGGTLRQGIDNVTNEALMRTQTVMHTSELEQATSGIAALAEPIISLLLYLCSEEPELDGQGRPGNPRPKKVKGGTRTFPVPGPRHWNVGSRIGAKLKTAHERITSDREEEPGGRTRPRPHLRRAHWALRWTGPRTQKQTPVLRWIQPTLVAADTDEELPATIRRVEP